MDILYEPDFNEKYAELWRIRGEFEDLGRIDLRWLVLLLVVLAFGALLSASTPEEEKEFAAMSSRFFNTARRALSEAPTYRGESMDTVRAYALVSAISVRRFFHNRTDISFRCTWSRLGACPRHGIRSAVRSALLRRKGELVDDPCPALTPGFMSTDRCGIYRQRRRSCAVGSGLVSSSHIFVFARHC